MTRTAMNSAKSTLLHLLFISMIGIVAYSNIFDAPFVLDDTSQIRDNRMIKDLDNFVLALKGKEFKSQLGYHFRPSRAVGYLSLALNYRFGGDAVEGYHAVNITIHLLCAMLVYFLVLLTFRTPYFNTRRPVVSPQSSIAPHRTDSKASFALSMTHSSRFISLFAALLFVAHPIQTQAVTYTIQRFASLATLFYLFSLVMYVKGRLASDIGKREEKGVTDGVRRKGSYRRLIFFVLSFLSAVLAMLTKETAFTLPLVIIMYEFAFFDSPGRKIILFLIPIILTMIILLITILSSNRPASELLSALDTKTRVETAISRQDYFLTQMRVIVTYLRLLFVPVHQNVDYEYPVYHSLSVPIIASSLFLLAILGTAAYLLVKSSQKRRGLSQGVNTVLPDSYDGGLESLYRLIAFGILWFFITLSVESSIIPIKDVIFEHRVYLPSIGLFIALAAGISAIVRKFGDRFPSLKKVLIPGSLIVIVALTLATHARNNVWRNEVTLWEDVAAKSPGKLRPLYNLGEAYLVRGQFNEGIQAYQKAVNAKPDDTEAHYNLGVAYTKLGRVDNAIREYLISISLDPNNAFAHNNLGSALLEKGRLNEAVREFMTAIRIMPDYAGAHLNLGSALMLAGRNNEALAHLKTAAELDPFNADPYVNMGLIYSQQNRIPEAIQSYQYALRITPGEPKIHYSLARAYVDLDRFEEAVEEFQSAIRISPDYAEAHHDLGAIYFRLGRVQEAISEFQKVLEIKPDDVDAQRNLQAIYKSLGGRPPVSERVPSYRPPS